MTLQLIAGVAVFVCVMAAIVIFGFRYYTRPVRLLDQLGAAPIAVDKGSETSGSSQGGPSLRMRSVLQWVGEKLPADPVTASFTQRLLMAAGFRSAAALPVFFGVRAVFSIVTVSLVVVWVSFVSWHPLVKLIPLIGGAVLGFWLPSLGLELLVERRQSALRVGLPDALDMLVVCVEAGISLDQALRMVSEELSITHPEICQDMKLISTEMRTGLARAHALRNFADRTMEPEISKLVSILIQTDRFGTSMGDSLRTHSDFMRVRRRQLAEEKAGKLSVQLIFPVFFCILPGILVLAAGPAFLQIYKQLMPVLGN